jgi:cytochrome c-type biogenesis protein
MTGLTFGSLFLEGLLSFFSPCVLPVVPLYIGYLTQDARVTAEDGTVTYSRKKTMLFTLAFILGVLVVYMIAGLGSGMLHDFLKNNTVLFEVIGGVLLIVMGLVSLHVIRIPFLERTYQRPIKASSGMSFIKAWSLGFFFSFAWTPCVGPLLAQAILLAAGEESKAAGWLDIASFALGFICIFLLLGLFTDTVLNFLKKYRKAVKYTGAIAGILVVLTGCFMLYQAYTAVTLQSSSQKETAASEISSPSPSSSASSKTTTIDDMNFTLKDAEGTSYSLTDFKGKTVIINFFGTWCYWCNQELPDLQKIQNSRDDVEVLLIAAPGLNGEGDIEYVEKYMKDAGYSMKILYDSDLTVTNQYGPSGYPCSYYIKPNGTFLGYYPGYCDEDTLNEILEKAQK